MSELISSEYDPEDQSIYDNSSEHGNKDKEEGGTSNKKLNFPVLWVVICQAAQRVWVVSELVDEEVGC